MPLPFDALATAFRAIEPRLRNDPAELRARLARRRQKTFSRPPRAWCLAVRAGDTRITAAVAGIVPEDGPEERRPHVVHLDKELLTTLCRPVTIAPGGEHWLVVAQKLGVSPGSLRRPMNTGVFDEVYRVKGLGGSRGKPVPILRSSRQFDPSAGNLMQPPDPLWGDLWAYHADALPGDFEQPIRREPQFGRYGNKTSHHRGWAWRCPACGQTARTLFLPLPVPSLPEWVRSDLVPSDPSDPDALPTPPATFACHGCHRVRYFTRRGDGGWNELITHLSGGLLYGHEVYRPTSARTLRPAPTPPTPRETDQYRCDTRSKIAPLLAAGWPGTKIARELGISSQAVYYHARRLRHVERLG